MSWRDTTPQAVQDDMDDLLDAALDLAEEHLTKSGEFVPFGLAIDADGRTKLFGFATGDARQAQKLAFDALKDMRTEIRAAAVATDVSLPETGMSGIEVHIEHANGPAIGVLKPYALENGAIRAEPLEGFTATRAIW
ncbi:hypothetical protein [Nocardia camponoti]|uniref:Uncharacterized protein n=1 Tax=Nocardia camponoti TaxID=1616106 RepID=A0A917V5H1_9NOCA|nr:hypothetical protein [Nocardia camponoti]GGK40541.1 hypothetical protein GCM10011591_10180 [Nocardia camponoti]